MANLPVTRVSSKLFVSYKARKELVAEHSDLGSPAFKQLYDDACDAGIEVINPLTNNVTRWALAGPKRDAENELLHWEFQPTPETVRQFPNVSGWKLIVIND